MSGIMLNVVGGTFVVPVPAVGSAYGGGYFAGQISTAGNSIADYNLVVGPVASAQDSAKQYKNALSATAGAESVIDGPQNTADIVADGNSTVYPAGHFCNDLVIGGFTDWYMPAKNELEICYYNLKPTTANNNTGGTNGVNANAVPARTTNYTLSVPAQTSAADFQGPSGTEKFGGGGPLAGAYWTSTENAAFSVSYAFVRYLSDGNQGNFPKNYTRPVRAVRRVAV